MHGSKAKQQIYHARQYRPEKKFIKNFVKVPPHPAQDDEKGSETKKERKFIGSMYVLGMGLNNGGSLIELLLIW